MPQRNLPASFWNPPSRDQIQQTSTSYLWRHSNSLRLFQESASKGTTYYSTGCNLNNASHVNLGRTATNVNHTRAIPVSYSQPSAVMVKSFPPGYLQQGLQPLSDRSAPPSYNDLLIQPEVKPQLPLVPGEPARANNNETLYHITRVIWANYRRRRKEKTGNKIVWKHTSSATGGTEIIYTLFVNDVEWGLESLVRDTLQTHWFLPCILLSWLRFETELQLSLSVIPCKNSCFGSS